ncbi:MAG: hypothetical protein WBD62_03615 [Anaerolineales bacterium]
MVASLASPILLHTFQKPEPYSLKTRGVPALKAVSCNLGWAVRIKD